MIITYQPEIGNKVFDETHIIGNKIFDMLSFMKPALDIFLFCLTRPFQKGERSVEWLPIFLFLQEQV